jgi:hypothetical protein
VSETREPDPGAAPDRVPYLGAGDWPIKQVRGLPAGSTPLSGATGAGCDIPFGGASAGPGAHYMQPHEAILQVLGELNYGETTAELAHHAGAVLLR